MPGQNGRTGSGWVAGIAALLAGVLLAAVGVAALRSDTASADTVLAAGSGVVLGLADGTSRSAVVGERIPPGGTVRAGRTGAQLVTRGRDVYLGDRAAVTVLDGARQVLRTGFVLVEAADAPGLELATDAATVTAADDSLVRVDSGPLLRAGVLRGDAADVRAAGRRAAVEVPTYYQVQVPTGGLPGAPAPFVLTPGDSYEMQLAGDLVRADADLTALASRLDTDGVVGQVVLSSLREQVAVGPALPVGAPGSERALGYLIAAATPGPEPLPERYSLVRGLRTDGGSWGIVAAIVAAPVDRVAAALAALLGPGTVPVLASGPSDLGVLLGLTGPRVGGGDGGTEPGDGDGGTEPGDGDGGDGDRDGGGDDGGDDRRPPTVPLPSPAPVAPVVDLVNEAVDTVVDLISPSPAPTRSPLLSPTPLLSPAPKLPSTPQLSPAPKLPSTPQLPPAPLLSPAVPLLTVPLLE